MARGDGLAEAVEYASGGVEELEVGGQRLRISQTDEADTIGTTIWAASRAQVALFAAGGRPRRLIQGRRLLELGAGCGLAGIGLGLLGAAEVTLTDIGQAVLANLRRNVGLNANAAEAAAAAAAAASAAAVAPCVYHVAELDWCEVARSLRLRLDGGAESVEEKEEVRGVEETEAKKRKKGARSLFVLFSFCSCTLNVTVPVSPRSLSRLTRSRILQKPAWRQRRANGAAGSRRQRRPTCCLLLCPAQCRLMLLWAQT